MSAGSYPPPRGNGSVKAFTHDKRADRIDCFENARSPGVVKPALDGTPRRAPSNVEVRPAPAVGCNLIEPRMEHRSNTDKNPITNSAEIATRFTDMAVSLRHHSENHDRLDL